jgi:two-component system, NtrC family, nitrogen regulation response regulator GlnG
VLSEGSFYRVGGHSAIKVQVRVIAATHQDLEQRVAQGHFREDLYHRLNVIRLRIPALRERLDDVPVLIRHFLQASATQLGVEAKRLAPAAMRVLSGFHFPGNVRQLENLCHWLTVMAPGPVNAGHSLTALGAPWTDLVQAEAAALLRDDQPNVWDQLTQKFESALITAAIAHTKGRRVDAANKLGIGRNTITRKIQDLGLYESLRDLR